MLKGADKTCLFALGKLQQIRGGETVSALNTQRWHWLAASRCYTFHSWFRGSGALKMSRISQIPIDVLMLVYNEN